MKAYIHLNEILTLKNAHLKDGRKLYPEDLSIIPDGAIVFDDKKILWVGATGEMPEQYKSFPFKSLSNWFTALTASSSFILMDGNVSHASD